MNRKSQPSIHVQFLLCFFFFTSAALAQKAGTGTIPGIQNSLEIPQQDKQAAMRVQADYNRLYVCFRQGEKKGLEQKILDSMPAYEIARVSENMFRAENAISLQIKAGIQTDFQSLRASLESLKQMEEILHVSPYLIYKGKPALTDGRIIVSVEHDKASSKAIGEIQDNCKVKLVDKIDLGTEISLILQTTTGQNVFDVSQKLAMQENVRYAQPNLIFKGSVHFEPNDPLFGSQWFLHNEEDRDIDAREAWDVSKGSGNIAIAVIDGHGFDLEHIEMQGKFAETYCAVNDNDDPSATEELENHGTPCAGLIGALTNNNLGVAGLGFKCKVIPIRIGYDYNASSFSSSSEIIQRAASHILNSELEVAAVSNSFGLDSWANNDAVRQAYESLQTQCRNGKGAVVTASTGNGGESGIEQYPCFFANVIGVGATTSLDQRTSNSNYGDSCDLVAPGSNLYTLDRSGPAGYENAYYTTFSGTSAACPLVAALSGLIVDVHPDWNSTEIMRKICYSCEEVGDYEYILGEQYPYGRWNEEMGYGRINAAYSLQGGTPSFEPPANLQAEVNGNYVKLDWDFPSGGNTQEDWIRHHDASFENAIASTEGGAGLAQHFNAPSSLIKIKEIRYFTASYFNYDSYNEIYVLSGDGTEVLAGPYFRPGIANGWISLELDDLIVNSSNFMIATYNTDPSGPYVGIDEDNYNGSLYFGNHISGFTELGIFGFYGVGSHEVLVEYACKGSENITRLLKPENSHSVKHSLTSGGNPNHFLQRASVEKSGQGKRGLLGYNIFRNGVQLNQELIEETTYQDNALNSGEYYYTLTAVYSEGVSNHTDSLEVHIEEGNFTPPTSLAAFNDKDNVELYWKSPGGFGGIEWMSFHDNSFEDAIASSNGGMGLAQRFYLQEFPVRLKSIRFFVSDYKNCDSQLVVFVLRANMQNVLSGPHYIMGQANSWLTIDIEDININESSFLIATYNTDMDGPYVGADINNYNAGLYFGNHIAGFVEMGQLYNVFRVGSHEALIEYLNKDGELVEELIGSKLPTKASAIESRALEHYNIYRDEVLVGTSNITSADDLLPESGTYYYHITAVYEEGESGPSEVAEVLWESSFGIDESDFSAEVSLYPNPGKGTFTINSPEKLELVRVLDIAGRQVYRYHPDTKTVQVDLGHLKAGLYSICFQSDQNRGFKKLIIE